MPKKINHDAQRSLLLNHWMSIIASDGYNAASMRRLAKAASVSTGSLYHYFPTKSAILAQAFDHLSNATPPEPLKHSGDPNKLFHTFYKAFDDHADHLRQTMLVALEVLRHTPLPQSAAEVAKTSRSYKARLGELLGTDDAVLLDLVFHYAMGLLMNERFDPDQARANLPGTIELLSRMLAASHTAPARVEATPAPFASAPQP